MKYREHDQVASPDPKVNEIRKSLDAYPPNIGKHSREGLWVLRSSQQRTVDFGYELCAQAEALTFIPIGRFIVFEARGSSEKQSQRLLAESGKGRCLDLIPRDDVVWMRIILGDPLLQLPTLRIGQRQRRSVGGNAIPNLFDQRQTLLEGQPVDTKRFD